ncbi:NYN domain-containing protein [Yoonia sp. 2307UL14-13]|uniref:NYN domain-containing protein n=1 Tax=Yoonia sp. 2307UL14-13 TaxID=3126506 RepID=UPI0030A9A94E
MSKERPLLAVLIDADNVPAKHAEAILKEINGLGEPALRRVYGDWSNKRLGNWAGIIPALGLVARQESANTTGKNASDIGLVIDAMDILHSGKFDAFVIVSSDSDFTALANRLREDGLSVFGIGEKKTPPSLISVCNRFIFIENIVHGKKDTGQDRAAEALGLFQKAFTKIDSDDEWVHLARLGSMIAADHPDFDPRTYGHGKLSTLARAIDGIETKREGSQLMVRPR